MANEPKTTRDAIGAPPNGRPSAVEARLRAGARQLARPASRALLKAMIRVARLDRRAVPSARAASEPTQPKTAPIGLPVLRAEVAPPRPRPNAPRDLPRILLLNPPRYRGIPVVRLYRSEYLYVQGNHIPAMDLAYFAALAKGRAHLTIVEANAEGISSEQVLERMREFAPDVIVQKGVLNILESDLRAALAYKKERPETRVVLCCRGSVGAEERVFEEFPALDGIARGEVDAFARDIAEHPELEGIVGLSRPGRPSSVVRVVEDLDEAPIPDLELMPRLWYSGFNIGYYGVPSGYFLTTSRGCPYGCTFCMVGGIDGRPFRYRRRDPENVAEEVRLLRDRYGVRDFYVFDEIFTMPGHGERVCERWLSEGLDPAWVCEGKPDLVNADMLSLMKRAGSVAIYYGVESGDDAILAEIDKGHESADARRAIRLTREAGIMAGAYVMLGFPGESWRSYLRTVRFLLEAQPDLVRYDFVLPYPVTILHRQMRDEGLLDFARKSLDRRISPHYDADIAIRTRHLRPRVLYAMDTLIKLGFSDELTRSPLIPRPAGAVST